MSWQETYKSIAEYINNAVEDKPNACDYIYSAFLEMVNLDSDFAEEVAALEMDIYKLWTHAQYTAHHLAHIKEIIKEINEFTEEKYGDLTVFVNGISWDDNCIPYYWGRYSGDLGFDISEWNICS